MAKAIDLTGQRFGKLIAIEKDPEGKRLWLCSCDCGGYIKALAGSLRAGYIKSCGCLKHSDLRDVKTQDLAGGVFGKLKAIRPLFINKNGWSVWLCKCECGKDTRVTGYNLLKNLIKSCGCLRSAPIKHGDCRGNKETDVYRLWSRIKERCQNPKRDNADRYYLRGIRVCDEWLNSYELFREFCITQGYRKGLQIDRIDNNGNYSPDNCRFVTPAKNSQNREAGKLTGDDIVQIKTLLKEGKLLQREIAEIYGVTRPTISLINTGDRWASN